MKPLYLSAAALLMLAACNPQDDSAGSTITPQSEAQEVDLHQSFLIMDSHLDTPAYFHRGTYDFSKRGSFEEDGTHVDLPRMLEGGLDGGFWVIYTPQGQLDEASYIAARTSALLRQMAIRELAAKYSDSVELAFTADDAVRINDAGKIIVFQSMENAYPLGEDISMLETFYVGGLRMVSPAHFRNNQFSDSATDVNEDFDGLSPLGEELVREANRLGLILDGSHASDDTVYDMMALSETPIILSHSGPAAVFDHPRNVPDELLIALAEDGGVIQINALGAYLEQLTPSPERQAALAELTDEFGTDFMSMTEEQVAAFRAARAEIGKQFP
ncbi:MAG: membrane dipeptidase, partial [Pseudomonadota bacterium]